MRFLSYISAIAMLATVQTVLAAPTINLEERSNTGLGERASLGVYYCDDDNFAGKCWHRTGLTSGQSYYVGDSYNDQISSLGPDQGTVCTFVSPQF